MPRGVATGPSEFDQQVARLVHARLRQMQEQTGGSRHDTAQAKLSLLDFAQRVKPHYEVARHNQFLAEHLEAVARRDITRLMVFMPPRHGKSELSTVIFPPWYLGNNPHHQVIVASYNAESALGFSQQSRNIVTSEEWPYPHVRLDKTARSLKYWRTAQNGVYVAAGARGTITGKGAHLLVLDDLVKGRIDAESELLRKQNWEWYLSVARSRLMPGGAIVLVNTRWHDDDLPGRLIAAMDKGGEQWTVINLPALAEEEDALGRAVGEPLWPEWYDRAALDAIRYTDPEEGGERNWSALYQQRPVPAEGNLYKLEWFSQSFEQEPKSLFRFLSVDGAYKEGVGNDFSVIQVWGIKKDEAYALHAWRGRVEFPELLHQIDRISTLYKTSTVLIEDSASGQPAIQVLRRNPKYRVVKVTARGTKIARAEASTKFWEMGKVWVPRSAPWLSQFMDEHLRFPAGKHDDHVDASSQALRWAMKGYAHVDRHRSLRVSTTTAAPAHWEEPVPVEGEEYTQLQELVLARQPLVVAKEQWHLSVRRTLEQVAADLGGDGDRESSWYAQGEMRRLDRMYGSGIR